MLQRGQQIQCNQLKVNIIVRFPLLFLSLYYCCFISDMYSPSTCLFKSSQNLWLFLQGTMQPWLKNPFVQRIKPGIIKTRGSLLDSLCIITWSYIVFKIVSYSILYFILLFLADISLDSGGTTLTCTCMTCTCQYFYLMKFFKHLLAHYTIAMNYSPLPPCFLQTEVPDLTVCIKRVWFNVNKHLVTV